jgi:hypothetical protein
MIFFSNKQQQQETDALVVQATAVLRAIRYHDDNCGKRKKNCCVSEIIKQIGLEARQSPKAIPVVSSAPLRHGCDNNLNDLP